MTSKNKQKRHTPKLKLKKGDKVRVIAGSAKGSKSDPTEGIIADIFPDKNLAIVEGVNLVKKHQKPTNDVPGGIIEKAAPIHISNLMLIDPKTGEPTRVGRKVVDGKIERYSKKSGEIIK